MIVADPEPAADGVVPISWPEGGPLRVAVDTCAAVKQEEEAKYRKKEVAQKDRRS
jgi:hypothetical protein